MSGGGPFNFGFVVTIVTIDEESVWSHGEYSEKSKAIIVTTTLNIFIQIFETVPSCIMDNNVFNNSFCGSKFLYQWLIHHVCQGWLYCDI